MGVLCLNMPLLSVAGALDQFHDFVASTRSAQGVFAQYQIKNGSGRTQKTGQVSGSFVFSRPGKFVWRYLKPYEQWVQSDGEQLYLYDKDLNQVTLRKLGNALGMSPAAILFGHEDWSKNFVLKEGESREGLLWLEVIPKQKEGQFERILIGLKEGRPHVLELHDTFGQTSVVTFQTFERNVVLKPDALSFVVPKGVDVLNLDAP